MLQQAMRSMRTDPARAAAFCKALLQSDPDNGDAKLLLSEALRLGGDFAGARAIVAPLAAAHPQWFGAQRQLGVILADMREPVAASAAFATAAASTPVHPTIWRDLALQLALAQARAAGAKGIEAAAVVGGGPCDISDVAAEGGPGIPVWIADRKGTVTDRLVT